MSLRGWWLSIVAYATEMMAFNLPFLIGGTGTPRLGSSQDERPKVDARFTGTSRAFWFYCAFLSLGFIVIGLGILNGATVYKTFGSNPYGRRLGIPWLVTGVPLTLVCLLNALRPRTKS